jgi:tRNA (cmo5U34)-methyltransferase
MMSERDNIYISDKVKDIPVAFNEEVTKVFEDMINRSVPGYQSSLKLVREFGRKYIRPDTNIYDLGCSLGAATESLLLVPMINNKILAVDNSRHMIRMCKERFLKSAENTQVEFILSDVREVVLSNASLVIVNYLMQFLAIKERKDLIRIIYESLVDEGACIISEKIHFKSIMRTNLIRDIHHSFKLENGYSDLEVARKRDALDGVLITETEQDHIKRIKSIGFKRVMKIMSNLNFITLLCVK